MAGFHLIRSIRTTLTNANRQISESTNQRIDKSANRQISESTNQRIDKSANRQISESTNQRIDKSANRQISESTNVTTCMFYSIKLKYSATGRAYAANDEDKFAHA